MLELEKSYIHNPLNKAKISLVVPANKTWHLFWPGFICVDKGMSKVLTHFTQAMKYSHQRAAVLN